MASPRSKTFLKFSGLNNKEITKRIGNVYGVPLPTEAMGDMAEWLKTLAGARNTMPEYVFLMALPTIATMAGPQTRLEVSPVYYEHLNVFMCVLGESGSGKICIMSEA